MIFMMSSKEFTTCLVLSKYSSLGIFISGTHITGIPALYPAKIPFSLSSMTKHSSLSNPNNSFALVKISGFGLLLLMSSAKTKPSK